MHSYGGGPGNIGYYENVQFEEGAKALSWTWTPAFLCSYHSGEVHIGEMCLATGEVPAIPVVMMCWERCWIHWETFWRATLSLLLRFTG